MWTLLLQPKFLVALALAGISATSYFMGHRAGAASVQAKWDIAITTQARVTLKQMEANRATEQSWNVKVTKVQNDYTAAKKVNADLADHLAVSLRDFNTANNSPASEGSTAAAGTNGAGGLERDLLGACAATLVQLAKDADRLEAKVIGLQSYVSAVSK